MARAAGAGASTVTAHAAIYGRLGQDPKSIDTRSGKPMCVCSMAVELSARDGEPATVWFAVIAFGRMAEDLARHEKGDAISVSGRLQQNTFTKSDGTLVTELQVVADSIVSARTVRPRGGRRAKDGMPAGVDEPARSPANGDGGEPFNDPIPW